MPTDDALQLELAELQTKLATLDSEWVAERDALLESYQVMRKGLPTERRGMAFALAGLVLVVIGVVFAELRWVLLIVGVIGLLVGFWEFKYGARYANGLRQYEEERQETADSLSAIQTKLGITPKWSKRARADRAKNDNSRG